MAGVGFSLRKLQAGRTYTDLIHLYGSAGLISSGPWLISILSLMFVGLIGRELAPSPQAIERFQVAVTWLLAASLLLSTPFQLLFSRHVSDLLYAERRDLTTPSMWGALSSMSAVSAALALACWPLFPREPSALKVLLGASLVVLSDTWIVLVVLTSLKRHGAVVGAFLAGYAVTFAATLALARHGALGLIAGFLAGQSTLLLLAIGVVARAEPGSTEMAWGFLERKRVYPGLLWIGFLYALGTWADKLVFWLHAGSSRPVLGPFRTSDVYDFPLFLAYLASAPGMAVFLLQVETEYAERHAALFRAIEQGANLDTLEQLRDELSAAARTAVLSVCKTQGATFFVCLALGESLLVWFGISQLHLPLFYVDAGAVSMQVVLLSAISILFYLDRRAAVLRITALFAASNLGLTLLSLRLGPVYYGYGFALATSLTSLLALIVLARAFRHLLRHTFTRQG